MNIMFDSWYNNFFNFKQVHIRTLCQFCWVSSQQKKLIIKIYQKQFRTLSRLFFENSLQINFEDRRRTYEEKIYEASD